MDGRRGVWSVRLRVLMAFSPRAAGGSRSVGGVRAISGRVRGAGRLGEGSRADRTKCGADPHDRYRNRADHCGGDLVHSESDSASVQDPAFNRGVRCAAHCAYDARLSAWPRVRLGGVGLRALADLASGDAAHRCRIDGDRWRVDECAGDDPCFARGKWADVGLSGSRLCPAAPSSASNVPAAYHQRAWLRIAVPLLVIDSFAALIMHADIVMVGIFLTPVDVAHYFAATRVAMVASFFLASVGALAGPNLAALQAQGKTREMQELLAGVTPWVTIPALTVTVLLAVAGWPLLRLFGPGFEAGYVALMLLAAGHLVAAQTVQRRWFSIYRPSGLGRIHLRGRGSDEYRAERPVDSAFWDCRRGAGHRALHDWNERNARHPRSAPIGITELGFRSAANQGSSRGLTCKPSPSILNHMVQFNQRGSTTRSPPSLTPLAAAILERLGRSRCVHQRPRRKIRDDPHGHEETREGPRGRRACHHRKGGAGPQLRLGPQRLEDEQPGSEVPEMLEEPPQPPRGIPRANKRNNHDHNNDGTHAKSIVTKPTDREIRIERTSTRHASASGSAFTDPKLVAQWWGRGNKLDIERMELERGGHWRFVEHRPDGVQGFEGRYREVTPPERVVQTFEWDGMPGHVDCEHRPSRIWVTVARGW